ncbi:MAG: NADH-quinone oxidoreductase subunit NuoF [Actinobacteria bacterium]|nr:NADH-quinone oxidoreductase subunit NuoF [Actinomycetota bacterium]
MLTIESYGLKTATYYNLDEEKVKSFFKSHIDGKEIAWQQNPITDDSDLADFFKYQESRVLRNRGKIDPFKIEDYISRDGYFALAKALEFPDRKEIIKIVSDSGLRGRGGAGFPTGKKWEFCSNAKSSTGIKYVVCNGDEGDPGAFMDRNLLESDPHAILEGMLIAALAIGSSRGYVYVRAEYPLAVETLENAIVQAKQYGLIGDNILGSDFSFDVEIYQGAGAFVCGEETALLASIEGKRGMPRPKPPFPANEGLYGMPTLINNVETFANIGQIILNGAEWFNSIGTATSKGTKIFALAGAVKNVGLVEVPMGMTLRDIVFKIGGGIVGDNKFKAVQLGGPSGGCIPEKFLDTPIDYEKVKEAGSIVGSGGMIVLDEETCMANLARYFMDFIQDESCGQCVPCRIGTRRMLEILERITKGKGEEGDLEKLERLAKVVMETSLCGLGKTAPNPVFSTLKYFREEFEEHIITQKSCERLHVKAKVAKV